MKNVIKHGVLAFVVLLVIAPVSAAFAQDDVGYDYGGDSSSYDTGYDYGGDTSYDTGYDYNTPSYDAGYDYGDYGSGTADGLYGNGTADGLYGSGTADGLYGSGTADGLYGSGTADGLYGSGTADGLYGSGYADNTYGSGYAETCDSGCVEQNGVEYSQESYGNQSYGSSGSYGGGSSFSLPQSFYSSASTPSISYSTPTIRNIPVYVPQISPQPIVYQQQQQQQQQQIQQAPVIVQPQPNVTTTTNTCTNYSCNTTYTDNSINDSFNTATVVPVAQAPVSYPVQYTFPQNYNYQNVSCSITAGPNSIQSGQYSYLSWQSYGAVSASLSNYGNVAPNGSLSIRPNGSQNYVLTVYGANGQSATCNTYVTMANIAPYVTLSQIPYTGFDFGSFGDAMYFAALALFALAAGYLLVYYKGGMVAFAHSMVSGQAGSMIPSFAKASEGKPNHTVVESKEKEVEIAPVTRAASVLDEETLQSFNLPVAETARQTVDSMSFVKDGGAPRLVISRA